MTISFNYSLFFLVDNILCVYYATMMDLQNEEDNFVYIRGERWVVLIDVDVTFDLFLESDKA